MASEKERYGSARAIATLCLVLAMLALVVGVSAVIVSFVADAEVLLLGLSLFPIAVSFLISSELITMLADIADNSHRQAESADQSLRVLRAMAAPGRKEQARAEADAEENAAMQLLASESPVVAAVQAEIVKREAASGARCKTCQGELPNSRDGKPHKMKCPTCGTWAIIR